MKKAVSVLMLIFGLTLSLVSDAVFAAAPTSPGPYTLPYVYSSSGTTYTQAIMTKDVTYSRAVIYMSYDGTPTFNGGYSAFHMNNTGKVLIIDSVDDIFGNGNDTFYENTSLQDLTFALANPVCFNDAYLRSSVIVHQSPSWSYQNQNYHCGFQFGDTSTIIVPSSGFFVPTFRNAAGNFRNSSGSGGQCVIYVRSETDIPYDACHGDAADCYDQAAAKGYAVSTTTPRVGSIMVFDRTSGIPAGHVGIVDAIDGNNLTIQDSNWNLDEMIRSHVVDKTSYTIKGYIYYAP